MQKTIVEAYQSEFEALQNRTMGLSSSSLTSCFVASLNSELRVEVLAMRPTSLPEAMAMACLQEAKIAARGSLSRTFFPRSAPPPPSSTSLRPSTTPFGTDKRGGSSAPSSFPYQICKISPAEMQSRFEKGLSYYYDAKYSSHQCSSKPQNFVLDSDEPNTVVDAIEADVAEPTQPEDQEPSLDISLYTLLGLSSSTQLRIISQLAGHEVRVLVNCGNSLNFIQTRISSHLHLPVECLKFFCCSG